MIRRPPSRFKVGGTVYPVRYSHTIRRRAEPQLGELTVAGEVLLATGLDRRTELPQTLIHELIHAADDTLGIGLSEPQVERLTLVFCALAADNKKLLLYLIDALG